MASEYLSGVGDDTHFQPTLFESGAALPPAFVSTEDTYLEVVQEPLEAKVGAYSIDPPPALKLHGGDDVYINQYFVKVVLVDGNGDIPAPGSPLQGTTVSSLHPIEDGGFFIFRDLSINTPGQFQLKFMLYQRSDDEAIRLQETISSPFRARKHRRVNSRAQGRGRTSNPPKRRLQTQVSNSDRESTWESSYGDYSPARTKTGRPRHKRRKISGFLRRDSSGQPAANPAQASYKEQPVHNGCLKDVIPWDGDISAPDAIESGEEEYDVEQILDWAWNNDKQQMEYRIKWEGFDSAENTWEPLIHLTQCQEQLAHFHRQREWTPLTALANERGRPRCAYDVQGATDSNPPAATH